MKPLRILTVAAALSAPAAALAVEVDGIAAQVDSAAILRSDVIAEMRRTGAGDDAFAEVRNRLIDRQLILKAAADAKLQLQDWMVENRLRDVVERSFGGDRNRLMEALARQKLTYPEWRQRMRDDMVVGAMRWQTVDRNVSPSPGDLRREYEAHPERYTESGRVTVSVILLAPESAGRRDEVVRALKEKPFAEVAREYSADSRAAEGGVWKDVVPAEVFKGAVCDEIARMPKGTISDWVEIDGWSFLLRKDDETGGRLLGFADAYERIDANVREETARRLYVEWLDRLRAGSYIRTY